MIPLFAAENKHKTKAGEKDSPAPFRAVARLRLSLEVAVEDREYGNLVVHDEVQQADLEAGGAG